MLKLGMALLVLVTVIVAAAMDLRAVRSQDSAAFTELDYRVVGGTPAAEGAWPWQVAIYFKQPDGTFMLGCGGSIVNPRWVLSAAHCFLRPSDATLRVASDVLVVEGTNQINLARRREGGKGRAVDVKRIVMHEHYDAQTSGNDIALLELVSPAESRSVPLTGSSESQLEAANRTGIVTGWGTMRPLRIIGGQPIDVLTNQPVRPGAPGYFTNRLMEVEIPLVDRETCQQAYPDRKIDERHICAGLKEGGKDSCQGDSGGPLITSDDHGGFRQIGIVSGGRSCGLPNSYGINTRVAAFETWIGSAIGLQPVPQAPGTTPEPSSQPPVTPPPRPADSAPPPEVPAATVAQSTLPRDNPARLTVEFVQGDTLKVGQSAQFKVSTEKPGYLLLIDLTPDGKMTQIFPNARSLAARTSIRRNLIEPGRPLLVPDHRDPYAGFEFKVEPPTGRGLLLALLTDQALKSIPTPDTPMTMGRTAAIDYIAELAEELNRDLVVTGPARPRAWSVATKPYRIDP
jgi:secreted trypsin-like serine protease